MEIGELPGGIDIVMDWEKSTDLLTIYAGPEFTVSFEAFNYYVQTLIDLDKMIERER